MSRNLHTSKWGLVGSWWTYVSSGRSTLAPRFGYQAIVGYRPTLRVVSISSATRSID